MASIYIPAPLRPYTDGKEHVNVRGTTVREVLADLIRQYPELEVHLFNTGELRSFVNIFLGDEDIRFLHGPDTEVTEDAVLLIIPSIAGG